MDIINEARPFSMELAVVPDNKMRPRSQALIAGTMKTRKGEEMTFELTVDSFVVVVIARNARWAINLDGVLRMAAETLG